MLLYLHVEEDWAGKKARLHVGIYPVRKIIHTACVFGMPLVSSQLKKTLRK